MLTHETFKQRVEKIPTLYTQAHAPILYGLVRWLKPQTVIEVGSYAGYATAWLARALQENAEDGHVIAIDEFSLGTSPAILHNHMVMLEVANHVQIIPHSSNAFPWPSCDFAFIDGDHSFEGVTYDFNAAVQAGAECIVIHDTRSWWGPEKFIHEKEALGYRFIEWPQSEGLAIYLKAYPRTQPRETQEKYPTGKV